MKRILQIICLTGCIVIGAHAVWAFAPEKQQYVPVKKKVTASAVSTRVSSPQQTAQRMHAVQSFQQQYGNKWQLRYAKNTRTINAMVGTKTESFAGSPENTFPLFLKKYPTLFGVQPDDLVVNKMQTYDGKYHIYYQETYKGIPIQGAYVTSHLTAHNEIFAVYSTCQPEQTIDTTPTIDSDAAVRAVRSAMGTIQGMKDTPRVELVIYPYEDGNAYLCWKVEFFCYTPLGQWIHYVDAHTGEIIDGRNDARFATGNVQGKVFPQYGTDAVITVPFAHEYIGIENSTQTVTDRNGNYTIDGSPVTWLGGPYAFACYFDGIHNPTVDLVHITLSWTWNEPTTSVLFDKQHLFYHMNTIHDYYRDTFGFLGMECMMGGVVYAGEDSSGYADNTIVMGTGDGREWRDFTRDVAVIYHEYTHGVQDHICPWLDYDNQSGAMMEAWADYFPCSLFNESRMGVYAHIGGYIRNLDNTKTYPRDIDGEVHDDSRIYSGALWDLRKTLGKELTDRLTFCSLFYAPTTFTRGLEAMLLADDNDTDLSNGTPHKTQIEAAFALHGIHRAQKTWEEYNDTLSEAYGPLTSGTTYYPFMNDSNDVDVFSIFATTGNVSVHCEDPTRTAYYMYVYDRNGNYVTSSYGVPHNKQFTCYSPQTYYVYVYTDDYYFASTVTYSLCVTYTPQTSSSLTGTPSKPQCALSSDIFLVTWTIGTCRGNIIGYTLQVGTQQDIWNIFDGNVGNVTQKTIKVSSEGTYYIRVRAVDNAGQQSAWSETTVVQPASSNENINVSEIIAYPNPCYMNKCSYITFAIPQGSATPTLSVYIYTIAGEYVRTLEGSSSLRWNGTNDNGEKVASGMYVCCIKTGTQTKTERVIIFQ